MTAKKTATLRVTRRGGHPRWAALDKYLVLLELSNVEGVVVVGS